MTKYVKFISTKCIEFPPYEKDGVLNYDKDIEALKRDGYKELREIERPVTDRLYEINYQENSKTINELLVWLETEEAYNARKLNQKKEEKFKENEIKRDTFLSTVVYYKELTWDSDIDQKINLEYAIQNYSEPIRWFASDGMSNILATKEDLQAILGLLVEKTTYVWQIKNPEIKTAITNAKTIEEVNAIVIFYEVDLKQFTLAQLKDIAGHLGISYPSNVTKARLIEIIEGINDHGN